MKWWRKSAIQGHAPSQYNLGIFYAEGEFISKDEVEAFAYLTLASSDSDEARKALAILKARMRPVDVSFFGSERVKQMKEEIAGRLGVIR